MSTSLNVLLIFNSYCQYKILLICYFRCEMAIDVFALLGILLTININSCQ